MNYAISTLGMIVFFILAGLVLLNVIPQDTVVRIVEGVAALVAGIALIFNK